MHKFFIVVLLYLMPSLFGGMVDEGIKSLPRHERACMKEFFNEAVKEDQLVHVLFFDTKPVCMTALVLKGKHQLFWNRQLLKGWRAFKRSEHLFLHPNFIISENVVHFDENFSVLHIYLANKGSLLKCLRKHQEIFTNILGPDFSPERFLVQLEGGSSLPGLLQDNEMLLGVLLGYGLESSKAYHEATANCTRDYAPPESKSYSAIELKSPKHCRLRPVVFIGDPNSSEVKKLRACYERELEEAWQAYRSSKSSLTMVLKGLCSDVSSEYASPTRVP